MGKGDYAAVVVESDSPPLATMLGHDDWRKDLHVRGAGAEENRTSRHPV